MTEAPRSVARDAGRRRRLFVKKFGGTSVSTVERMREVARLSCETQRAGNDVVVVVSAMSGETDRLLSLSHQMMPAPDGREMDVVVSTGEQVSCALVAMAITAQGGEACSLLGHQVPVLTDSAFTRARIQRVERARIEAALARGQIPVVAGFQGTDGSGNVTTLGRGGSDATAVALAAALSADECEIYTDVDGVYTGDPRVVPGGRKLDSISYDEMLELAALGARVLQARSVEIAMKHKVPVHVRSSFRSVDGTRVTGRDRALEARVLTGVACARGQVEVELGGLPGRPSLLADLTAVLADAGVSADMVSHATVAAKAQVVFTMSEGDLSRAREPLARLVESLGGEVRVSGRLAKVSLVGIGVRSDARLAARVCQSLLERGIPASGLAVGELRISCLVDEARADEAVCVLHEAFDLSRESPAPEST